MGVDLGIVLLAIYEIYKWLYSNINSN
jgi:hypothetical protein